MKYLDRMKAGCGVLGLAGLLAGCSNPDPEPPRYFVPEATPEEPPPVPAGLCGAVAGQPEVFEKGSSGLLAMNNDSLFWIDESWVRQKKKDGGTEAITLNKKKPSSYHTHLVAASDRVFVSDLNGIVRYFANDESQDISLGSVILEKPAHIWRFQILPDGQLFWMGKSYIARRSADESTESEIAFGDSTSPEFVATGQYVYHNLGGFKEEGLTRVDHEGKSPEKISSEPVEHLATDGLWMYWIQRRKKLWRMARGGGAPELLSGDLEGVTGLLVAGGCVYLHLDDGIWRLPREGGALALLAENVGSFPSMVADANHLYWTSSKTKGISRLSLAPGIP